MKLNNPIVLGSRETTSAEFSLDAGQHVLAASVGSGATFPDGDITLQFKFGDTDWSNTDAVVNSGSRITTFWASAQLTWRVVAANAGATVHISPITLTVFQV